MKLFILLASLAAVSAGPSQRKLPLDRRMLYPHLNQHSASSDYDGNYGRVVGGTETGEHEFPHMARIYFYLGSTDLAYWTCGGSLIDDHVILTAAHCTDGSVRVKVVLGAHNVDEVEPLTMEYRQDDLNYIITHPLFFRPTINNDIGLIRITEEIAIIPGIIEPIMMASVEPPVGTVLTAAGWGAVSDEADAPQSSVLKKTDNPVVDDSEAESLYEGSGITFENKICVAYEGSGVCGGDSGGPLMLKSGNSLTLVGIVSFGGEKCEGYLDCFTSVPSYLDWINENS